MNIKVNDEITFVLKDGQTFHYTVYDNFLCNKKGFNGAIFTALGIKNPVEYCQKFWSAHMGDWPTYNRPSEIALLLQAWIKEGIKISVNSYDFYKSLFTEGTKVIIDTYRYSLEGNFLHHESGKNNIALKAIYGEKYIDICKMCYGYDPYWTYGVSWPEFKSGDYDALLKLLYYTKKTRGVEVTIAGFSLSTDLTITPAMDYSVFIAEDTKTSISTERSARDEGIAIIGDCIEDSATSKWEETAIDGGRLYPETDEKSSYKTDPSEKEVTLTLTKHKIKF